MTQIGIKGWKISEKLDYKTINKGGLTQIDVPVLECSLASEHETMRIEVGGYKSFINYNKFREKQHRNNKFNQKMRALRRNIKNKGLRQSGLTIITHTGAEGGHKS